MEYDDMVAELNMCVCRGRMMALILNMRDDRFSVVGCSFT
jgi:hypothetical protein